MLQESGGLLADPISIDREMWIGYKIYIWFLLFTFAWATLRVGRVWRRVPPFSSKAKGDPDYVKGWQRLARSFARWAGLVLIGWGLLFSIELCRVTGEARQFSYDAARILSVVGDLAGSLAAALFVVLFLYLIRWHLLTRIDCNRTSISLRG